MKKYVPQKLYSIITLLIVLLTLGCANTSIGKTKASPNADISRKKYDSFKPRIIFRDNNGVHINAHGGGLLVHNDTYFFFGQHMVESRKGNRAQVGVHCYSSKDLYNWNDEGIALKVSNDPKSDITKGCVLERPKVIYNEKTKKFVMWFHLELKGQRIMQHEAALLSVIR